MVQALDHIRVRVLPDGRLNREDAAAFLGMSSKTLATWKSKGLGPRAKRVGGRVFYQLSDLETFRDSFSAAAAA